MAGLGSLGPARRGLHPRLAELAQNPLMLTMLLSVFVRRGGSLPEQRSELYRAALHAMLERADTASKGGHGALALEPCLRRVAYASHARPRGEQFRIFKADADAVQWDARGVDGEGAGGVEATLASWQRSKHAPLGERGAQSSLRPACAPSLTKQPLVPHNAQG